VWLVIVCYWRRPQLRKRLIYKSPESQGKQIIRELRDAEPSITPEAREGAERADLRLPAAYAARVEAVCNRFEARLLPLTDANATGRGPSRSLLASGLPLRAIFLRQIKSIAAAAGARGVAFSHSVEALLRKEIAWSEAYPVSPSRLSSLVAPSSALPILQSYK
jgi:hypothetical protein